jgi:hypothetical protein
MILTNFHPIISEFQKRKADNIHECSWNLEITSHLLEIIHAYHSRLIPEGVTETSQIFLRDTHTLPKLLATRNTADVTDGKPRAI